jgi:hypothetical protein
MESLARLVVILMSTVFLSGPLGFLLTSKAVWNYSREKMGLWIIRRVLVVVIALLGSFVSFMLVFSQIPLGPRLFIAAGFALNIFVLKREFFRAK